MTLTEEEKKRFKDWANWYETASPCHLCSMKSVCYKANIPKNNLRALYRVFTICPLGKNLMGNTGIERS